MPTCIYCLTEADTSAFDTEHVLPRAIGSFADAPTLIDSVCSGCNAYFGSNLELYFARGSIEALLRLQLGVRPARRAANLQRNRLSFTIDAERDWQGVRLEFQDEDNQLLVSPVPQVGFAHRTDSGWTYLTEHELTDEARNLPPEVDAGRGIKIVAPSDNAVERLIALLGRRGIPFHRRRDLPPPPSEADEVLVIAHAPIDPIIRRCIAKIAFNYMTWVAGSDFALHSDFNVTRHFIRHGIVPNYPLVVPTNTPILADDFPTLRQTRGHLITLNWTRTRQHIVAQVSPFNEMTYRVSLARNFSGVWRDIRSGHHFNITEGRISRLTGTSSSPRYRRRGPTAF